VLHWHCVTGDNDSVKPQRQCHVSLLHQMLLLS